jgi:hypothetical protein
VRICRVFKEVFRRFWHFMAGQFHDVFAFHPGVTGHRDREKFHGQPLRFLV